MKRLAIILLILLLVVPVEAAISDKLSPTNSPEINAKIKAEEYSKIISAKETTVTKDAAQFKYNIKKIQYDSKLGTVDIWCNLYIDGREKAVRNPIHVYNPPVYHITGETIDIKTGQSKPTYIEDPDVVLSQILYDHAITLKNGKAENDDTLIVYSSLSNRLSRTTNGTWAELHDGEGELSETASYLRGTTIDASTGANQYDRIGRRTEMFFTGGLGDNSSSSIDSAQLGLCYYTKSSGLGSLDISLTGFAPASFTVAQATDYDTYTDTRLASDIAYADIGGETYDYFSLNAAGVAYINTSGYTPFMVRFAKDIDDTAPTWAYEAASYATFYGTSYTGTSRDPKITITYTVGGGPVAPVAGFTNTTGFPLSGQLPQDEQWTSRFTDASTNTPTSWNWSFGDGNMTNSTSQNPIHTYLKAGTFTTSLYACNVAGCDAENKTGYVNILPKNVTVKDFVAYPLLNGTRPLPVAFVFNMSNGSTIINLIRWNLGNYNTSTNWNPTHTYSTVGEFDVSLDLVNTTLGNFTVSKSKYINVTFPSGPLPTAAFTNRSSYPLSGPAPLTVQFEDQSTNTPTTYNWSWSNSSTPGIWTKFNETQNGTGVFSTGTYSVNLTVCNVAGCDEEIKTDYVTVIATAAPTVCYYMSMTNATVQNATWTANVADGWVGVEANASNSTAFWYHCVTPATPATTATTPPPTPIPNLPAASAQNSMLILAEQYWWVVMLIIILWVVKK